MDALRLARRIRSRVRAPGRGRTPGRSDPTAPPVRSAEVDRILRSGLFDRRYYEIQAGQRFDGDEAAVRHFLQHGHRAGLSPHPLFEPEWYGAERPRARPNTLLRYLAVGGGEHGPGPAFDETAYLAREPEAALHPGGALGHFVSRAADDDPLPSWGRASSTPPTWGRVRQLAYECAEEFRRDEDLRSEPRRGSWDEAADERFVAAWAARTRAPSTATPTVSVVMPVRNRPVQVLEAIASVQQQSLQDWELLVVDDGSTDETPDVVARVAAEDPRIRLVRRDPAGVSSARNAGIDAATGEWLAFLDSDNTWVPHFLHVMVTYLEAEGLRAGHAVIDTMVEPEEEGSGRYLAFDGGLAHLLVRNHIDLNGFMVRTSLAVEAGGFDESLRRWVDHDLVIRVARLTDVPRVPFVGVRYDHSSAAGDRITTTEPGSWEYVVLGKNHIDWDEVATREATRRTRVVSVCMVAIDWADTRLAVDALLRSLDGSDTEVEVVVVINGARRSVGSILRTLYTDDPRVRFLTLPRNLGYAIGANVAFGASTGARVVFLDTDTEVLDGWLPPLLAALDDPGVLGCQALLLEPDGFVQSAGWAFTGLPTLPSLLLAGHPVDDARRAAPLRLSAVCASALAIRAPDFIRLRGFDPWFANGYEDVDLCLRAGGGSPCFRVATDSLVVHHRRRRRHYERDQDNRRNWMRRWTADDLPSDLGVLEGLGLRVLHLSPGDPVREPGDVRIPAPVVVRPVTAVPDGAAAGQPCLRWALKVSTPMRDDDDPDLDLAAGLGEALRRLGQDVVVDRLEAHQRPTSYLDDVAVPLCRAALPVDQPGAVNLAWVLDEVPVDDLTAVRYDAFLAITDGGATLTAPVADPLPGLVKMPTTEEFDEAARLLLDRAVEVRSRHDRR